MSFVRLSPDGSLCLSVFRRNQFKIIERESNTTVHTHIDSSLGYTSAHWCDWSSDKGKEFLLVLGCKTGQVQIWSVRPSGAVNLCESLGEVAAFKDETSGNGNYSSGFAVAGARERNSVFVGANQHNSIVELKVNEKVSSDSDSKQIARFKVQQKINNKGPVLQLAYDSQKLIAASPQKIKVYNAKTDFKVLSKQPAPQHACTQLMTYRSSEKKLLVLACDGTDSISVYSEDSMMSLVADGSVQLKHMSIADHIVMGVAGEQAFRWNCKGLADKEARKFDVKLESKGEQILALLPLPDSSVAVALGNAGQPKLASLKISSSDKTTINIQSALPENSKKRAADTTNADTTTLKKVKVSDNVVVAKPGLTAASLTQGAVLPGLSTSEVKSSTAKDTEHEKLVKALNEVEKETEAKRVGRGKTIGTGPCLSLAPLIQQYLKSKDDAMLASCLVQAERKLVVQSVKDLSGQEAFGWFRECERLLSKEPQKVTLLTEWIKQILSHHVSFLLTNTSLKRDLQSLYRTLDLRLASHNSLLRLQGKLDLLLSTAKTRLESQENDKAVLQQPIRSYSVEELEQGSKGTIEDAETESEFDDEELAALMNDEDFDPEEFL